VGWNEIRGTHAVRTAPIGCAPQYLPQLGRSRSSAYRAVAGTRRVSIKAHGTLRPPPKPHEAEHGHTKTTPSSSTKALGISMPDGGLGCPLLNRKALGSIEAFSTPGQEWIIKRQFRMQARAREHQAGEHQTEEAKPLHK